ncbi:nicotinate-nucleotide--dimethylbenzimidazole phosphoribosyltransferase [Caenispirillum bisanense]|uniref:Nicotinate-nucleotide--dimethylbenzimidazole phosphoribosyltransferase n=1 Tax=Caenispirillum bisanense TaxID=414052 RepID=A0A286GHU1_9PROT|nr:nicotinate-nucleotide--dimethylbenzimidazole phosphoribosyltransferase [Caenispirillum bisanense]SOD95107.1 nicotinate-nucleotide-dimethylbenzimidazole phosphoribosyltransferase [Caenispirillum bisanense]
MSPTVRSVAEFRDLLSRLPAADGAAAAAAAAREPQLTKPPGSLGRLEDLAAWLAAWQGRHPPVVERVRCAVFAGNHGVAALGVSAFPAAVTAQMVENFRHGGAAVNQLCRTVGAELTVTALALDRPTADFTQAPALTEDDLVAALNAGLAAAEAGLDALCLGEMGIANTTSAAAIGLALYGGAAAEWTGPGTGVAGSALARKAEVVAQGVALHGADRPDGVEVLRRLGGRELAAIAGAVAGARLARVPVVLDGYICTAAAACLEATVPGALDHCVVAHASAEPGHRRMVERLGKQALLDLGLRLGEGSGAVLAVSVLKAAAACHAGMATFAEAGVAAGDEGREAGTTTA